MNKYSVPSKEERKKNMLAYQEKTETDAVSTEFYYEYGLDANNEIDDLILKDKRNIYTFNGDRY